MSGKSARLAVAVEQRRIDFNEVDSLNLIWPVGESLGAFPQMRRASARLQAHQTKRPPPQASFFCNIQELIPRSLPLILSCYWIRFAALCRDSDALRVAASP